MVADLLVHHGRYEPHHGCMDIRSVGILTCHSCFPSQVVSSVGVDGVWSPLCNVIEYPCPNQVWSRFYIFAHMLSRLV